MMTNASPLLDPYSPEGYARGQLEDALAGLRKCVEAGADWLALQGATNRVQDAVNAIKRAQPPAPPVVPHGHCCLKAKRFSCVCREAVRCPEHGERHHGTHD